MFLPPSCGYPLGGGGKRGSKNVKVSQTSTSTKSPSLTSYTIKRPASATITTTKSTGRYGHGHHSICELDVMIIGYGYGNRMRRRGSIMSAVSDVGSDDSALSSTSSGLRRKPIPLEIGVGFQLGSLSIFFSIQHFLFFFACLIVFVAEL